MTHTAHTAERAPYSISTDPARLDLDTIWGWLRESYWSPGVPRDTVARAIDNSIPFGIFEAQRQVGFARVVTDRATFAYLADVFIDPTARGRGLGVWLMEVISAHPDLQGLRRWMLATRDAHGLYRQYGFVDTTGNTNLMEIVRPDIYQRPRD
ncbi:MAG: GNAT family N-acetyltransferase [Pseudomonadota bacterium]